MSAVHHCYYAARKSYVLRDFADFAPFIILLFLQTSQSVTSCCLTLFKVTELK